MFSDYQTEMVWLSIISLVTFVISLLTLPWLVTIIPEDYFLHKNRDPSSRRKHPLIYIMILVGKNILGGILLIGGILMLFLPGQGLLTIAIGLLLLDYPGKYHLERRIVAKPAIFNGLNWLRKKANKPPLKKPTLD